MRFRAQEPGIELGGPWSFAFGDRRIPGTISSIDEIRAAGLTVYKATVPGNFELDLLANGLIEEPFFGMNVLDLRRYENSYVYYFRTFVAPEEPDATPYLVFEGIDCFADILLNGRVVHQSDNMLVEQHVPVGASLRAGQQNFLCVVLQPAMERARLMRHEYPPGLTAEGSGYESLHVRKAPHMYGWNIMPRALSAGLWRPVALRYVPTERLDWVWLETEEISPDHDAARLAFHYQTTPTSDQDATYELLISGACGESRFEKRIRLLFDAGCERFRIASPQLWWPSGRGGANLYEVDVQLIKNGSVLDAMRLTHGIRTVELERTSVTNEAGEGQFCFWINGERVFILGTNWVPLDAYHSRDAKRIPPVLDLVEDIGCNMIRCWGGNVYENDLFYDLCDRKGILVWQDFAMACAIYPQDRSFQRQLRSEVTQVVRRLRQHACLAIWAGDNECDQKYVWGPRQRDPNTNTLTREVIPAVLRDEDPSRPYLPSSPYIDPTAFQAGEKYLPENHLWGSYLPEDHLLGPQDYFKSTFYTAALCHFASEIGFHGCPEPATLRKFLSPEKVWPYADNNEWLLHSTSPIPGVSLCRDRVDVMANQVRALFGTVPDNLEDFVFASQAAQAEGLKFFVEMFRIAKWRRTGIIWWNIIDGWPQFSDAIVDYYLVKKRAYDVLKRSQSPICVFLQEPQNGTQEVVISNDTRDDLPMTFEVRDINTGVLIAAGTTTATADGITPVAQIAETVGTQRFYLLEWDSVLGRGQNHYLAGRPPFSLAQYRSWIKAAGL